jgi:hypothetical protein
VDHAIFNCNMRHRHHHQHHHRVRWIIRSSTTTCGTGTSPGGRSWHHYHNGGPGIKSIFLRYDELRSVSFERSGGSTRNEP